MANRVDAQSVGRMVLITPSDTAQFEPTVGLSVNVDGNVNVQCVGMDSPVVRAVVAGVDYPWRVIAVYASGTSATGIVALYQE